MMNTETATTVALVLACVALGFVFGVEVSARLAIASANQATLPVAPEWLADAKLARNVATGAFGVLAVGATGLYARQQQ